MTTKTIKSGGSVGVDCDYTTVQSWFNDCPSDITATGTNENWIGELVNECVVAGRVLLASGKTTDATHYVELRAKPTYSFRDHANKATNPLKYDATKGAGIRCTAGGPVISSYVHLHLTNLQIRNDDYQSSTIELASNPCTINNCIVDTVDGALYWNGGSVVAKNSLFTVEGKGVPPFNAVSVSTGSALYNCTIGVFSDGGDYNNMIALECNNGTVTVQNCAIFGGSFSGTGNSTFTTCYTNQGTKPSGCTQVTYADCFVDTAKNTRDFRLKANSPLIDVGTTDSTNAANDIIGTGRPSGSGYDVGCWEYVGAGAATPSGRNLLLRVG